ncbi:MAG TPA: hypothetical protein VMU76_06200, partial [Acidimicrobiales bacterium]|nr:hypothetical protein [Acidimicrobiales bacterium]
MSPTASSPRSRLSDQQAATDGRAGGPPRPRYRGLVTLVVSALLLGGGFAVFSPTPKARPAAASSPASVLGVYAGSENVAGVRQFGQAVGVQPANAMDFLDGSSWASII